MQSDWALFNRVFNPLINPFSPNNWKICRTINFKQKNKNFFIFFKKKFPDKFTNISIVHIYSQLIIFNTRVKMLCYYNFSEWFAMSMMLFTNYSHAIHNLLTFNILWKYLLTLSFYSLILIMFFDSTLYYFFGNSILDKLFRNEKWMVEFFLENSAPADDFRIEGRQISPILQRKFVLAVMRICQIGHLWVWS